MRFAYFDAEKLPDSTLSRNVAALKKYRTHVMRVFAERDVTAPEYSLAHITDPALHDQLDVLKLKFKGVKHVILVGIGGSSLGAEAVHSVLDTGKTTLHVLDTIAPYQVDRLLKTLASVRSVTNVAVCVVSKSGGTTETLVNASVILAALEQKFKKAIYAQTIFIGNAKTDFMKAGKRLGATCVSMPETVGGRYSVATEVGLVPLALLGHDVDAFMGGVLDSASEEFESVTAEHAARLQYYLTKGFTHYNFFAFEPRLAALGAWYRQLQAESLGKASDITGKKVRGGFVPTVSTAVELHSIGQLYLSGLPGVYTDFVVFDDEETDFTIPKKGLAKAYSKYSAQEVATAIYGGVVEAYQEKDLSYRSTIFDDGNLAYSLGLFMGMRMRETMYLAHLMRINAFDQPNVELYKTLTKKILGL
ncbi:hypothetical protein KC887_06830 [Candidatus Kaiserbacteria bacterium]|nr:hypothetical protein [Candidatus Kaiserbacteria bacterium]